jgi:two-component system, LuxR family, secretion system response regulator SsrB
MASKAVPSLFAADGGSRAELSRQLALGKALRVKNRFLRASLTTTVNQLCTLAETIAFRTEPLETDARLRILTPRELSVLRLIALGQSTKQIAGELHITFKTAVTHRTHIMEKLAIHNVADLTRLAIRSGLVPL